MRKFPIVAAAILTTAGTAHAATLATTVSASGDYGHSLDLLTDGVFPPDYTSYNDATSVFFGPRDFPSSRIATFTFDFGGLVDIDGIDGNVDNNDDYIFTFFDGSTEVGSYTYGTNNGTVTFGLQNFSTHDAGASSPDTPAFMPFRATSATVTAAGGDNIYGIGEIEFTGAPATGAVPEPATWAMMIGGLGLVGGVARASRRADERFTRRLRATA